MNCENIFEKIPQLINSSLGKVEESEVLTHLMSCENCRQELAFWIKVSDLQPNVEIEFDKESKDKIFNSLLSQETTAWDITKQAVKVYFKVIESIL